jgi:2-polyprenyl-3-methyl-5-hydroxy-6-metoxy-1,4-benzoquinol methylase
MFEQDTFWKDAQLHEGEYWGNCLNLRAWGEFVKQEQYGREMDLFADYGDVGGELDMQGKSVLDVGGGPVSMTLRCYNSPKLVVADPLEWPPSALRRYKNYGIKFVRVTGEDLPNGGLFDEVWMYNVLQHVKDPALVLAKTISHVAPQGKFRIFEWINIPADTCHPHVLTPEMILNGIKPMRALKIRIPVLSDYWANGASAFVGIFVHRSELRG